MAGDTLNGKNGGSMSVNNVAYDKDVQVAGGVTAQYAKSTLAAGAAVTVNRITNDIQAAMTNMNIGNGSNVNATVENLALSKLTQIGTAVSAGLVTGNGKTYAVGEVAVADNDVKNTVKATLDGGTIYAKTVASEARDGSLKSGEADNKYLSEVNAVPNDVTVNSDGYYVKDNRIIVRNEQGQYVYQDNGQVVDVFARADGHIFDLDGSDALQYANGSDGFDLSVNESGDSLSTERTYSSNTVSVTNEGNVIVGAAIGLAGKTSGESGSATAAAAVNINKVDNDFTAELKNATIYSSNSTTDPGVLVQAKSKTNMIAVAAGVAAAGSKKDNLNITAAGSGVKNEIDNDTTATVENSTISSKQLKVAADTAA